MDRRSFVGKMVVGAGAGVVLKGAEVLAQPPVRPAAPVLSEEEITSSIASIKEIIEQEMAKRHAVLWNAEAMHAVNREIYAAVDGSRHRNGHELSVNCCDGGFTIRRYSVAGEVFIPRSHWKSYQLMEIVRGEMLYPTSSLLSTTGPKIFTALYGEVILGVSMMKRNHVYACIQLDDLDIASKMTDLFNNRLGQMEVQLKDFAPGNVHEDPYDRPCGVISMLGNSQFDFYANSRGGGFSGYGKNITLQCQSIDQECLGTDPLTGEKIVDMLFAADKEQREETEWTWS